VEEVGGKREEKNCREAEEGQGLLRGYEFDV